MGLQEIEYLDFRFLTVEQSKLYNEIVPDMQDTFNQIIGSIYKKNRNNHNWYFSTVASRNPHQSPLFERLCKVCLVETLFYQSDFLEVYVDDYCLYNFILKNFRKDSLKVFFVGKNKTKFNIIKNLFYTYAKYIAIILCKWALSSFHRLNLVRDKELFLIDTFVYCGNDGQGTINNGVYNDRYFPNLIDHANNVIDSEIVYVPTLLIGKEFFSSYNKLLKQKNFLAKEPFLNVIDWLSLIILPLKKVDLKGLSLDFKKYNILELINDELLLNNFSTSKLIAGINYNFIKRLKNRNISIKGFIEWYENQVIDRGMILGLRKNFPNVKVCAYQGFVICPIYNFYLAPTKYENFHLLTPHLIAVTGNCLLENPKKNYNIKTITAPAFRFQHLYKSWKPVIKKNRINILFPFSICLNSSLDNLKMLFDAVQQSSDPKNFQIIVNLHPTTNSIDIRKSIQDKYKKNLSISNQMFYDNLRLCDLLVGSTSSACVEALVYGLNILIIGSRTGITSNPIPRKYIDKCSIVYSTNDLKNQIEQITVDKNSLNESYADLLNDCFCKVDLASIHNFLSNTIND